MRVVVTGANGFVGRVLAVRLAADGHVVVGAVRRTAVTAGLPLAAVDIGLQVDGDTDWSAAVRGADAVVHLVARTHRIGDRGTRGIGAYRSVNVAGTTSLLKAVAQAGVRRLVFVSSIKVNGERTIDHPYRHDDQPAPEDAYGITKWEAEQAVREAPARTGVETVIVRPPLIYGPGSRGNFARLCSAIRRGIPLPLAAVRNRRSLVAIDNLVDLLARCVAHDAAAGETFLVSDDEDLSTPELIRRIAGAMRTKARLLPVPPIALRIGGRMTGRKEQVSRLLNSLQVDASHTRSTLGWDPPIGVNEGLLRAVRHG